MGWLCMWGRMETGGQNINLQTGEEVGVECVVVNR